MALLGSAKSAPGDSERACRAVGWFLFYHDASDCYWWSKDPDDDEFQGDGEVSEVTGIAAHEYRALDEGTRPPPGWIDPLVAGPEYWSGQRWVE